MVSIEHQPSAQIWRPLKAGQLSSHQPDMNHCKSLQPRDIKQGPASIDLHLRKNENGFREGRTTTAQILALKRVIEQVKKDNLTAVL